MKTSPTADPPEDSQVWRLWANPEFSHIHPSPWGWATADEEKVGLKLVEWKPQKVRTHTHTRWRRHACERVQQYVWERVKSGGPLLSGSTGSSRQYGGFMQGSAPNVPSDAALRPTTYPPGWDIYNSGKLQLHDTNSWVSSGGERHWLDECDAVCHEQVRRHLSPYQSEKKNTRKCRRWRQRVYWISRRSHGGETTPRLWDPSTTWQQARCCSEGGRCKKVQSERGCD